MMFAVLLVGAGAFGLVTVRQWWNGLWLGSARWVVRWFSPHMLVGVRTASVMVIGLGLMLVWPPAFLLAFGAAIAWIWVMHASAQTGAAGRLPRALRPAVQPAAPGPAPMARSRPQSVQRRAPRSEQLHQGQHRRAG